ncbi:MAG: cupredoxin family protein [Burkholderiaceae bacterium]
MTNILARLAGAALAMAMMTPIIVHGHGNETHGKPAKADIEEAEQMPWGIAGDPARIDRTIEMSMSDAMRFTPDRIDVRLGETIRFVIRNDGKLLHEYVLGTRAANDEHAALMVRFPNMEHDAPYMAHVPAGETGEIVWHFNRAGRFDYACLIAGHYQAGMIGSVTVDGQ